MISEDARLVTATPLLVEIVWLDLLAFLSHMLEPAFIIRNNERTAEVTVVLRKFKVFHHNVERHLELGVVLEGLGYVVVVLRDGHFQVADQSPFFCRPPTRTLLF